jgi:oligopeptide/dipeptide ABC transporter ATP-binding protein
MADEGLFARDTVRGELADGGAHPAPRDPGKGPDGGVRGGAASGSPLNANRLELLAVRDLEVRFHQVRAVDGVSFELPPGPFGLGLVGESGSGKTTVGRALLRLVPLAGGEVLLEGRDVTRLRGRHLKAYRRAVQIVLQDPDSTLDPRMRVQGAIGEALRAHRIVPAGRVSERVRELLHEVGLQAEHARRLPHQLSGGQRQRVSIARALAVEPRLLVLDEPTSALDVTAQAHVLELIQRLRAERQLTYLLVSHNLAVVGELCERTAVMYLGRIVELGPTGQLLERPAHPYTRALRSAVPEIDAAARRARLPIEGEPGSSADLPSGCVFHPRCPLAIDRCRSERPVLREVTPGQSAACHRAEEVLENG